MAGGGGGGGGSVRQKCEKVKRVIGKREKQIKLVQMFIRQISCVFILSRNVGHRR